MKRKAVYLLVALALAASVIGLMLTWRNVKSQDEPEPYTLRWRAHQATAAGQTELKQVINAHYRTVNDLNDAVATYSVVLVQPISRMAVENDGTVASWYKVRIVEQLTSRPRCAECVALPPPPGDLGALAANQLAIIRSGGTLQVDGVTITTEEADFPDFLLNQTYMLFLDIDTASQVAIVPPGPVGAYLVDNNGVFVPLLPDFNHVHDGLTTQYGNSLAQLRAGLGIGPPLSPGEVAMDSSIPFPSIMIAGDQTVVTRSLFL